MKSASGVFTDVITKHYSLKKKSVIRQLEEWERRDSTLTSTVAEVFKLLNTPRFSPAPSSVLSLTTSESLLSTSSSAAVVVDLSQSMDSNDHHKKHRTSHKVHDLCSQDDVIDLT